jgi:hypothetical protein
VKGFLHRHNHDPIKEAFLHDEGLARQRTGSTVHRYANPAEGHCEGKTLAHPANSFTMLGTGLLRFLPHHDTFFMVFLLLSITTSILFGIALTQPEMSYGRSKSKPGLFSENRKDPFSLPPRIHLLSKGGSFPATKGRLSTKETKPSSPPITVKAILISDRIRLASIDRHILTVGDSIHDEKILEIKNDRVILGKGNNLRTLFLSQSPIQITVEDK